LGPDLTFESTVHPSRIADTHPVRVVWSSILHFGELMSSRAFGYGTNGPACSVLNWKIFPEGFAGSAMNEIRGSNLKYLRKL